MPQTERLTRATVHTVRPYAHDVKIGPYCIGTVSHRDEARALARAVTAVLSAAGGIPTQAAAARRSPAAAALRVLLDERRVLHDEQLDGRGRLQRLPIDDARLAPIVQRTIARFSSSS